MTKPSSILVTSLLILCLSKSFGQIKWNQRITIKENNISIERLLVKIQSEHDVYFAFGLDNYFSTVRLSIDVTNETLLQIVNRICQQGNLVYKVIGSTILFSHEKREPDKPEQAQPLASKQEEEASPKDTGGNVPIEMEMAKALPDEHPQPLLQSDAVDKLTRTSEAVAPVISTGTSRKKNIALFLNYSLDYNRFSFITPSVSHQRFTSGNNNTTATLGTVITLSRRWHVSLGAGISNKDFRLNYNYLILDVNDPFPVPDQTHVSLRYFEAYLKMWYSFYSSPKFTCSLVTGVGSSFLTKENETTTYVNKTPAATHFFIDSNRSRLGAASMSIMAQRSILPRWRIYLEPQYQYFFHNVNSKAMEAPLHTLKLNAGIHFDLVKKT
jgi:hypothetical protein